jgi:hypothetical protein
MRKYEDSDFKLKHLFFAMFGCRGELLRVSFFPLLSFLDDLDTVVLTNATLPFSVLH